MGAQDKLTLQTRTNTRLALNAGSKRCAPLSSSKSGCFSASQAPRTAKNSRKCRPRSPNHFWTILHPFVCFYRSKSIKRARRRTRTRILSTFSIPPARHWNRHCARAPYRARNGSPVQITKFYNFGNNAPYSEKSTTACRVNIGSNNRENQ